ncbi:hypothetical protein [Myxococcus sp. RHSTA-1-4]|uniref:hypothetical protein n=1 Tax=Myxococcus sp. RHSTA-1-4 TaxID=2874601 RepID=UPI001CC0691F|nr:hypothetical protein [Myxococcus sp. RHSTA-1-4]MBZ4419153.1 hypothetical protein [Myxococcus sp. RHSTA-1-4]
MPHEVPHSRLLAEAEAWPLCSNAALRHRTTRLGRAAVGILDAPTASLASELEAHLRLRSGGRSLSSLSALRDRAWFGAEPGNTTAVALADYAVQLAQRYLVRAGTRVALRRDNHTSTTDIADRAAHWRWLGLRLPADLLVAALHAPNGTAPPGDDVALATAHLERLLQRPVAETHLHVGAAFGFPLLWTTWMSWLCRSGPELDKLQVDAGSPFGNGEGLRSRLLTAAVARVLFAAFLWKKERGAFPGGFAGFEAQELPALCARLRWPSGATDCLRLCSRVLAFLHGTVEHIPFAYTRRLYALLTNAGSHTPPDTLDGLRETDPLAAWLRPAPGGACPETLFTVRALHYLLHTGRGDTRFAELFWQYERIRGLVHAHLIQEPGTSGLDWFGRHYRRLSPLRGPLEELRFQAAVHHQSRGLALAALETRTAPPSSWTEVRDEVRRLACAGVGMTPRPAGAPAPELGLIFHFIKEREHKLGLRRHLHADPSGDPAGFRFGVWFRHRRREALALQTALFHHPELLLLTRGLDVASTELAIPTWAVAPLLSILRETSVDISAALARKQPTWQTGPLRLTCHAGEEFSRLVEGLRRIHELKEAGLLQNGDRLGHGLALGTDPRRWATASGVVVQPAEERLEDLLWELDRYGSGEVGAPARRIERVRTEALTLARRIYSAEAHVDLDTLREARRLRHQPEVLQWLGFPDRRTVHSLKGPEHLVLAYLTDVGLFRRGQELVEVRADEGEVVFLQEVQHWLCSQLARLEVTVEANPSSNLLIADLLGVDDHPVLRMAGYSPQASEPPGQEAREPRDASSELMISINSDDPITFATCLADEYAYFYFALLRRQVPSSEALAWLDTLREHGMRSRFTQPASADERSLEYVLGPAFQRCLGKSTRSRRATRSRT